MGVGVKRTGGRCWSRQVSRLEVPAMHAESQHKKHEKEENITQLHERRKVIRIDVPERAKTCQCQDPDDGSAGKNS